MKKVGIFVGEDNWKFLNDVYALLSSNYQVEIFKAHRYKLPFFRERLNRLAFRREIRSFMDQCDICFFEWSSELLTVASHVQKRSKIVVRLHRYELYQWVDKINWDVVDKIVLVSHAKKEEFISRFPEQQDKISVIPVLVSLDKFSYSSKQFSGEIGILSNLIPRKRIYELVLAFYDLSQKIEGLHLHIGGEITPGDEDYFKALQNLVNELKLVDKVTFYGNVSEPWNWFKKIDIFISNSYSEGLQVALMEAMASGCYCLSHRWIGADELLPQENLFYTNTELQNLILNYSSMSESQKQEQKKMMRNIISQRFNAEDLKCQLMEVFESIEQH
jgi:glycosyltransferase involved in cell wall biosynthesis